MPNVLIMPTPLRHRPGRYRDLLLEAGFAPLDPPGIHRLSEAELAEAISMADAVLAGGDPITGHMIRSAPRLRAIARAGVGYESVDLKTATTQGIAVAITPGANHESVAEHALAMVLALSRNLLPNDRMVRSGGWERSPVRPLRGTTMGICGLGRIGKSVATRALAFGMNVVAFDRNPDRDFVQAHRIQQFDFEATLRASDVLSINMPLNRETQAMFGRRAFAMMKPGAILVNTSRGGLIDESALHEALLKGQLAGAGLDVLCSEPPERDHPLLSLPNVVFSPHIGGVDTTALDDMAEQAARVMIKLHQGNWPEGCIVNEELRPNWRW